MLAYQLSILTSKTEAFNGNDNIINLFNQKNCIVFGYHCFIENFIEKQKIKKTMYKIGSHTERSWVQLLGCIESVSRSNLLRTDAAKVSLEDILRRPKFFLSDLSHSLVHLAGSSPAYRHKHFVCWAGEDLIMSRSSYIHSSRLGD